MSPDNEYFWIEPEEVRALAPSLTRKRPGASPKDVPLVTEPWLEKPTAPAITAPEILTPAREEHIELPATPIAPSSTPSASPVPVSEAGSTPSTTPLLPQDHSGALEDGAENFRGRTPDERLEEFVEWLAARHQSAPVLVLANSRTVVTARSASAELMQVAAGVLPEVIGALPKRDVEVDTPRVLRLEAKSHELAGAPALWLPVWCDPVGALLCLVLGAETEAGRGEIDALHRIFAQLVKAMAA